MAPLVAVVGLGPRLLSLTDRIDDRPVSDDSTPVSFLVRPGARASEIGEELERAGLIRSSTAFRVHVELQGVGRRLSVGEYELRRNMSVPEIVDTLGAGRTRVTGLVTIPEGWRAEEIAQYLELRGVVSAAAFLEAVAGRGGGAGVPPLPEGTSTFEGYLFPESYDFGRNATPEEILRRMVAEFQRRGHTPLRGRASATGFSVHQLVTLASIIEREAVHPEDRPRIAAVYHNRLALGMALQADPTVQYALVPFGTLSLDATYWKRDLTAADLAIASPYNTYRTPGLPPAPIANPGAASLEAAASPAEGGWLYFVATRDGSHLFADTIEQHNANVARARAPRP